MNSYDVEIYEEFRRMAAVDGVDLPPTVNCEIASATRKEPRAAAANRLAIAGGVPGGAEVSERALAAAAPDVPERKAS